MNEVKAGQLRVSSENGAVYKVVGCSDVYSLERVADGYGLIGKVDPYLGKRYSASVIKDRLTKVIGQAIETPAIEMAPGQVWSDGEDDVLIVRVAGSTYNGFWLTDRDKIGILNTAAWSTGFALKHVSEHFDEFVAPDLETYYAQKLRKGDD